MHLVDITLFYTSASGGVRTFLDAKARWFANHPEHQYHLLVPGTRHERLGFRTTLPALPLPFTHGYRFPLRTGPWVRSLVDLEPDLIEAEDSYALGWAGLRAARMGGIPVVGFYHSDLPRLIAGRIGGWVTPLLERYVTHLYRHFDLVLAPSKVVAARLSRMGVPNPQVQPLGVDIDGFHPRLADSGLRNQLGIKEGTFLLCFVGRGAWEKNIPLMLECMRLLGADFHLLLVGPRMPRQVPENVTVVHEFAPMEQVARFLASSDALIHAGDRETFGLVVLEAMASGTAVIGVRGGAVAELVHPGCGLLVEPGSVRSFVQNVRALAANGYRGMGRIARREVERRYAWGKVLDQLMDRYRELAHSGHDPRHGSASGRGT